LKVRKDRHIGNLNPIPYAAMVFNCIGWLMYGFIRKDFYLCFANWTGVIFGYFYVNTCLVALGSAEPGSPEKKSRDLIEQVLIAAVVYWGLLAIIAFVKFDLCIQDDLDISTSIFGISCVVFTIIYFGSPLSSIIEIVKTKDSSSIYRPMIVCNFINCMLWVIYGSFSTGDINMILPNGAGAALAIVSFVVSLIYPSNAKDSTEVAKDNFKASIGNPLTAPLKG
jgi:solute carrier family 50 (sugar transporter)